MNTFQAVPTSQWSAQGFVTRYKLRRYQGAGASFPVESNETWATKGEAEAVAERVNAGDETGVTFASYSDD